MRRLLSLWLLCCSLTLCYAQQPSFLDTFKPDNKTFDFGNVKEGTGKLQHEFKFTNRGSKPVSISQVNTWCGCLVADYTKKAVRPGETATVKVDFNPANLKGKVVKQVVLLLNNGKSYVRVWIKANVIPYEHPVREDHPFDFGYGLYMSQQLLPFPELKVGQTHTFYVNIANDTDKPMTVEFRRVPNNTVLKMLDRIQLKPRQRTSFKVSYTWFRKHDATRHILIYPLINGKKGKPLMVRWNVGNKFELLNG